MIRASREGQIVARKVAMDEPMKSHPFADLFPLMEGDELAALADDIREHGLLEAIVTIDDAILDGRNRFRACEIAGVAPRFLPFGGGDPLAFVLSRNLARRHLNESQRAMIAAGLATLRDGQRQLGQLAYVPTQGEAARALNVGERSVKRAAQVRDHGTPEIVHAVEQGRMAVSVAAQATKLAPEQQRRIAERAEVGDPQAARNLLKKETRAQREQTLAAAQRGLPDVKFGVILADPEWRFEPWSRETGLDRAADNHYPTSALDVIAARRRFDRRRRQRPLSLGDRADAAPGARGDGGVGLPLSLARRLGQGSRRDRLLVSQQA
jgi:hypothetical protein